MAKDPNAISHLLQDKYQFKAQALSASTLVVPCQFPPGLWLC